MLPISSLDAFGAAGAVFIGAWVQGSIGFGLAVVAAPLLVLIEPDLVPGPLILNGLLLTLLVAYRERRSIDARSIRWTILGSVAGTALAAAVLRVISAYGFTILFSALVLLGVGLSAIGLSVPLTRRNTLIVGGLSGFMGTTSSIGGPPVALLYQNSPGPQFRGTLSAYFCVTGVMALLALAGVGKLGSDELTLALPMLPALVIGYALSGFTARILDRRSLRPAVLTLSAISAAAVLVRQIL